MMQVVTAHKGVLSYETTVRGLEWHSSQPHLGVNAVQIAAELVAFLSSVGRELDTHGHEDARFDPPHTTVHVGTIHGGTARNIISHLFQDLRQLFVRQRMLLVFRADRIRKNLFHFIV